MKKTPNKISTEDLLKALDSPELDNSEIEQVFDFRNDIPLFLAKFQIEAGENSVPRRSLYSLYLQFSTEKVSREVFGHSLSQFVTPINRKNVGINKSRAEITRLLHEKNRIPSRYQPAHIGTRKHYELFLEQNKVKDGKKWLEGFVLYEVYKKWCRQNRKSIRFKFNNFISITKLFLEHKKTAMITTCFKIDKSILEVITFEEIKRIRNDRRKSLDKKAKTKKAVAKG